jgi:hypothetical protein
MDAALALLYMRKRVREKKKKGNKNVLEMEFSMSQRRNCGSTTYREREMYAHRIGGH